MARLKVLYPGNHTSSGNIGADIENVVRYLNSAEIADNTLSELMAKVFDTTTGKVKSLVEMRLDTTAGLQYRVGEYVDAQEGWNTLSTLANIRGTSGSDTGTIGAPLFSARQDIVINLTVNGQIPYPTGTTVFSYQHDTADAIVVYINGALQATSTYTHSDTADTVTLSSATSAADVVTIYKVQSANDSGYARTEVVALAAQAVFPFVHTADQSVLVYRNGILQRPGGTNDYTQQPANSTITFTSALTAGDLITFIIVADTAQVRVSGLMTEAKFTDANGYIPFGKLAVTDDEIPQAKVNNLTGLLANRGRVYVSATQPTSSNAGDMWVDTASSPNVLKFYNGTGWLLTSPDTGIPAFTT